MYLYGASGHAKVIIDILKANDIEVKAIFDDNPELSSLSNIPVYHLFNGESPMIISIGDCQTRKRLSESLSTKFFIAKHPSAIVSPSAKIGEGTVVMHGAVIQADTNIGKHCIINTNSSVDHDCRISDYVHVASGATLCGSVSVGECTWIGAGSVVKQGIKIGKNTMIGAGSVVVKDIPDGVVAYGNPCRIIRNNDN